MIKYHDNIHGQQYGEDHMLTDNWNPNPIYGGDEYIRVYYRVDCPDYGAPSFSFPTEEKRAAFYAEVQSVLDAFGIPEGIGREALPGMEHLYIHPQDISGVVAKNRIAPVAEALAACSTFSVRWVDLYDEISPMTDAEFDAILREKKTEIAAALLLAFQTKRSNLYRAGWSVYETVDRIADRYSIRRRSCESGTDYTAHAFCDELLKELVLTGEIVTAETREGIGYRTAKPKDKKAA